MSFQDIWTSINDQSWDIVDSIGLGGIFDEHDLPPVLFPLSIVLILLLVIFLILPTDTLPPSGCGDRICQTDLEETYLNCPLDCPAPQITGKKVTLKLSKLPDCQLTVKLFGPGEEFLHQQRASKTQFIFDDVGVDEISFSLTDPYENTQLVQAKTLHDDEETISLNLGDSLCKREVQANGVLRLVVLDASTQSTINSVKVSIAEIENGRVVNYVSQGTIINGQRDFTLPSEKSYSIFVEKDGYNDNTADNVEISSQRTLSRSISLTPLENPAQTGNLEVCVTSDTGDVSYGLLKIETLSGEVLETMDIAQDQTNENCYLFEDLAAGKTLKASLSSPPIGCIPGTSPQIIIEAGRTLSLPLNILCLGNEVGYVKIKVIGKDDEVLTEDATITLWTENAVIIPGDGIAKSLAIGTGGYSQEVIVPTDKPLYAWIRGLPSGYLDYKSDLVTVQKGEHKAVDIRLNYSMQLPSSDFIFDGISAPSIVPPNKKFTITINKIFYDETELSGSNANIRARIGSSNCDVSHSDIWKFECVSPSEIGEHEVILKAIYNNLKQERRLQFSVHQYASGDELLTITPVFLTRGDPPLELFYDIRLNDTQVTELLSQNLTLTYVDSSMAYPGELGTLEYLDDFKYWGVSADVPFKGDYRINMLIEVLDGAVIHNTSYSVGFTSTSNSDKLMSETHIIDSILLPDEEFRTITSLTFNDKLVYGQNLIELQLDGVYYSIPWNRVDRTYSLVLSAPSQESCSTKLKYLINREPFKDDEKIKIIDISRIKSINCPLTTENSCNDVGDVRKCVSDYKSGLGQYLPNKLSTCIDSGCPSSLISDCPSSNKGDLYHDCRLTDQDLIQFEQFLQSTSNQLERNRRSSCMDMDNDNDVDDDDLKCLQNTVINKWYGDTGVGVSKDGTCIRPMNGAFCFDINPKSGIPGDLQSDDKIDFEDEALMDEIIEVISFGVTPPSDMLKVADFNGDGTITSADKVCLRHFVKSLIDLKTGEIIPFTGDIPQYCVNIFQLACENLKGDINGDGKTTVLDILIMRFVADDIILLPLDVTYCADIDNTGTVDEYDLQCMVSIFNDDLEHWMACLGCDIHLPPDAVSTHEICNDGYDNNCDGLTDLQDPLCTCGSMTPCEMKYDVDKGLIPGILDGNFKKCVDIGNGYAWMYPADIDAKCDESDEWADTYMCGPDKYTCSFNYPFGFTMTDEDKRTAEEGSFAWFKGNGNIGPIGVAKSCDFGGEADCPEEWDLVYSSKDLGTECGSEIEKYGKGYTSQCSYCRFRYDFCEVLSCTPSGSRVVNETISEYYSICAGKPWSGFVPGLYGEGHDKCARKQIHTGPAIDWCADDWISDYTERCAIAGTCMGLLDDVPLVF